MTGNFDVVLDVVVVFDKVVETLLVGDDVTVSPMLLIGVDVLSPTLVGIDVLCSALVGIDIVEASAVSGRGNGTGVASAWMIGTDTKGPYSLVGSWGMSRRLAAIGKFLQPYSKMAMRPQMLVMSATVQMAEELTY